MPPAIKRRLPRLSAPSWPWLGWLLIVGIYLASVSACGLWDPWETHYGEVARNILVRGDPLDLWWKAGYGPSGRGENVFYSKHALPFWCMALGLRVFSVGTSTDPAEMAQGLWPELALRTPSMIVGLGAALFLSWVVSRCVSRRAGLLTGIVLATMPQYAIVTRQAITDIYFVGPVMLSLGAWMMASIRGDAPLRRSGRGRWWHCAGDRRWWVFAGVFLVGAVLPLLVLHVHVVRPGTVARVSRFAKMPYLPTVDTLGEISRVFWGYWALALAVIASSLRWRTTRQVWMGVVYVGGGLSLMGKGFLGPGLIGLLILVDMLVSGRIRRLHRVGLASGVVIFGLTCLPWHHAMWLYRGEKWFHELIILNNLSRFLSGEQDQAVGNFGFYLQTLGIAAFPWSMVLPLALVDVFRRLRGGDGDAAELGEPARPGATIDGARDSLRLAALWWVISLAVISYSVTKYYHYLLPVLPPTAVLIGAWLDRSLGAEGRGAAARDVTGRWLAGPGTLALAGIGSVVGTMVLVTALREPAWIAHLTTYLYTGMWRKGAPEPTRLLWCAVPAFVGLAAIVVRRARIGARAMLLAAYLSTFYVIDDYLPAASETWSQRSAFQTYFRERGPTDRLLSWWFYYRGETLHSKARIWVSMNPARDKLQRFIEERREDTEALWFITIDAHARRLSSYLPADLRERVEVRYENHHYVLMRVPLEGPTGDEAAAGPGALEE